MIVTQAHIHISLGSLASRQTAAGYRTGDVCVVFDLVFGGVQFWGRHELREGSSSTITRWFQGVYSNVFLVCLLKAVPKAQLEWW